MIRLATLAFICIPVLSLSQNRADVFVGTWTDSITAGTQHAVKHNMMTISIHGSDYTVTFTGKNVPKGKFNYKNDRGLLLGDAGDIYYVPSTGHIKLRGSDWVKCTK